MDNMALMNAPMLHFKNSSLFGIHPKSFVCFQALSRSITKKPLLVEARGRANTRTENAKIRNRRMLKKYNGTATHPRLSVFCSDKQLYAMLVDDKNRSCLFYGSTLQKSIRQDPSCSTLVSSISSPPFLTNKHRMRQGMHLLPFIFGNIRMRKYITGLSIKGVGIYISSGIKLIIYSNYPSLPHSSLPLFRFYF
ncbi:uncharacterized protein LOC106777358 isoform X1 [Vigna radiata var. radiata]|uniref:Uncharacterized protein LOC106777358 isoform X1 n=1 Tax=Vigna radiata var. radiata TaxID=3916 RepID=A0A3Q0EHW9_VIGRR|nr:uncharacterized protein LOC106777358 isoform X1 [Vigna radiata var. radiata]XP_022631301.1 uncharacterized protein LOC106777358 isoform X1 [Vigna radiata var. radiata]